MAWNGSDPVFGLEKFEERNGSILVFGFGGTERGMPPPPTPAPLLNTINYF
jgi:hypothetical protein